MAIHSKQHQTATTARAPMHRRNHPVTQRQPKRSPWDPWVPMIWVPNSRIQLLAWGTATGRVQTQQQAPGQPPGTQAPTPRPPSRATRKSSPRFDPPNCKSAFSRNLTIWDFKKFSLKPLKSSKRLHRLFPEVNTIELKDEAAAKQPPFAIIEQKFIHSIPSWLSPRHQSEFVISYSDRSVRGRCFWSASVEANSAQSSWSFKGFLNRIQIPSK